MYQDGRNIALKNLLGIWITKNLYDNSQTNFWNMHQIENLDQKYHLDYENLDFPRVHIEKERYLFQIGPRSS